MQLPAAALDLLRHGWSPARTGGTRGCRFLGRRAGAGSWWRGQGAAQDLRGCSAPLALRVSDPACPVTVLLSAALKRPTGVSASVSHGREPKHSVHEPKLPADLCLHPSIAKQVPEPPGPGIFLEESRALSSWVQVLSLGALLTSWWVPAELATGFLGDGAGSRANVWFNGLP